MGCVGFQQGADFGTLLAFGKNAFLNIKQDNGVTACYSNNATNAFGINGGGGRALVRLGIEGCCTRC